MRKVFLIIGLVAILFQGCMDQSAREANKKSDNIYVNVWCDKQTNIEYLVYDRYDSGGITVRLDSKGLPKTCEVDYE